MLERIRSDKRLKILSYLILIVTLALIFRVAYAFLESRYLNDIKKANIAGSTVDKMDFIPGEELSIFANSSNLLNTGDTRENLSSTTKPKITLLANSVTNDATLSYYIYLDIINSGFKYTTEDNKPEIILTIIKPDNEPLTQLGDLAYKTENGVTGFDITEFSGRLNIAEGYPITSKSSTKATEHEWIITITYVNLSTNQIDNIGESITTKMTISKEPKLETYAQNIAMLQADALDMSGSDELYTYEGELTYHNGSIKDVDGNVIDANDYSYRYSGNNPKNFVCLGSTDETGRCLNNDGQVGTDNLYRIIGMFPFSSDGVQQSTYSDEMEYRIKLIKSEYITEKELKGTEGTGDGSTLSSSATGLARIQTKTGIHGFYWNTNPYSNKSSWYNLWEYGEQKATLNTALNGTYLTNLENKIGSNKIAETKWHIGGYNTNQVTAKEMFDAEMGTKSEGSNPTPGDGYLSTDTKIGLMYASDYGYAAANINNLWTSTLDLYYVDDNRQNNWMYNGVDEWAISRNSRFSSTAFGVSSYGSVYYHYVHSDPYGVRPVFYLKSDVELIKNDLTDGSATRPYTIAP